MNIYIYIDGLNDMHLYKIGISLHYCEASIKVKIIMYDHKNFRTLSDMKAIVFHACYIFKNLNSCLCQTSKVKKLFHKWLKFNLKKGLFT